MVASVSLAPVIPWRPVPRASVTLSALRDGAPAEGYKLIALGTDLFGDPQLGVELHGDVSATLRIPVQTLVDQPVWALRMRDATPPARLWAQALEVPPAGGSFVINSLSGGGGGEATDPGTVAVQARVDGAPAGREVVFVERKPDGEWRYAGHGSTDTAGAVDVEIEVVGGGHVYAVAPDDFGMAFAPGAAVPVGRRIRPSLFLGVLYEITEAGTLPASEPAWWPITTEGSRELGTARAEAVRYYRPLAHGPVTAEPS